MCVYEYEYGFPTTSPYSYTYSYTPECGKWQVGSGATQTAGRWSRVASPECVRSNPHTHKPTHPHTPMCGAVGDYTYSHTSSYTLFPHFVGYASSSCLVVSRFPGQKFSRVPLRDPSKTSAPLTDALQLIRGRAWIFSHHRL